MGFFIGFRNNTQNNRLQALRGFSVYLNTIGIISYIPRVLPKAEKNVPYLMEDADILAFFEQVDLYNPHSTVNSFNRMATEYKVLFRMIYCCGLRNNEACSLKNENVDTVHGVITIIHSKGDKDPIVYLSEDMRELCSIRRGWLLYILKVSGSFQENIWNNISRKLRQTVSLMNSGMQRNFQNRQTKSQLCIVFVMHML